MCVEEQGRELTARVVSRWRFEAHRQLANAKALNAVLRAHGAPEAASRADSVRCEVGQLFRERVELALSGVHRHFLSNTTSDSLSGVESLVLDGMHDVSDSGASLSLSVRPDPSAPAGTRERIQDALGTNVRLNRPVRVVRSSQLASSFAPERGFRYDGLFMPRRLGSRGRWEFVRLPDQPPLGQAPSAAADIDVLAERLAYVPAKRPRPSGEERGQPPSCGCGGSSCAETAHASAGGAHAVGEGASHPGPPRSQHRQIETFALARGSIAAQAQAPVPPALEGLTVSELQEVRAALLLSHDPMTVLRVCTWAALEQGRVRAAIEALHEAFDAAPALTLAPWPRRA